MAGTRRPGPAAGDLRIGQPIVLVGLMGSGKSTIGRRLANRLGLPFVDADAEIERRAGRTIAEIFATDGEPAFRSLEAQVMKDLVHDSPPSVIASGGGAVLDEGTCQCLRADATTIWLRGAPEVLAQRIGQDASRPLLTEDPRTVLRRLDAERSPRYRSVAHHIVEVGQTDRRAVVQQIQALLRADAEDDAAEDDDAQEARP